MPDQDHGQVRVRLAKLDEHLNETEQSLARSALMWLHVAQRPLCAHELWMALQIEASQDIERIERLVTESGHVKGQSAVASLQALIGDLVTIRPGNADGSETRVSCCDQGVFSILNHIQDEAQAGQHRSRLSFATPEAHLLAADVCMKICSATTLRLAHVHDNSTDSSLIIYAWNYWSTHLSSSGVQLSNQDVANRFNEMVNWVCTDASMFLLGLVDFVTAPIILPAAENYRECVASIRDAQLAIERPSTALAGLFQGRGYSIILQNACSAIEAFRASNMSQPATMKGRRHAPEYFTESSSEIETLSIDQSLRKTLPYVGKEENRVIMRFADAARGLRSVCVALSRSPIYEALLRQYGDDHSPIDVLLNVANWMEAVASYPYWDELSGKHFREVFSIHDPSDPSFEAARLIRMRTSAIGLKSSPTSKDKEDSPVLRDHVRPSNISSARWFATGVIYKTKSIGRARVDSTFTINDIRLSQPASSFSAVPSYMHSSYPLTAFFQSAVPSSLHQLSRRQILSPLFTLRSSYSFSPLDEVSSIVIAGGMANLWRRTNPALFRDGYRTAFLQFGIAVLVHHIRRILVPWLGAWMYNDPLEDLRLARGNPEVFLDEMLDFSWPWLAFMYIQKWAFDLAGAYLAGLLVLTNGRLPWRFRAQPQASPLLPKRAMATAKVCYLAWMLACAEYMFARTLSTVSFGLAYAKLGLLSPANSANRAALDLVLRKHWSKAPLNACQLVAYTARGVIPMVVGAVTNAARGRPGLLLALSTLGGGVWMAIRYRSRFFIALEMSSMFVVIGCAAVLLALLGREFVADPLGLGVSTAMARRSGNMLREAVQVERLKRAPAESVRVPP